jgi:hypothetical protein
LCTNFTKKDELNPALRWRVRADLSGISFDSRLPRSPSFKLFACY